MRQIVDSGVDSIVVSLVDSEPQGIWAIEENSNLIVEEGLPIKSTTLRSISKLIGDESDYKDLFANGTFTHSFLNVNDYHRYHFPVCRMVREVRLTQGIDPTGGNLWWDSESNW